MDDRRFDTLARTLASGAPRRAVLRTLTGAALVGFAAVGPRPAPADAKRDAECPGAGDTNSFSGTNTVAQTFTALRDGRLNKAKVLVARAAGGDDLRLEIRKVNAAGVPTSKVLAATTVNNVPETEPFAPRNVKGDFDDPPRVKAGKQYALTARAETDETFALRARSDTFCDGDKFIDNGGGFTEVPDDLIFTTFVKRERRRRRRRR